MKFRLISCFLVLSVAIAVSQRNASVTLGQTPTGVASLESQRALVNEYCARCHNERLKSGGFSWTDVDLAHPENHAQQLERVIRKLRAGMMPPSGQPRPAPMAVNTFT